MMGDLDLTKARAGLVADAADWIPTPYHRRGRVKHAGADCFTFIVEILRYNGLLSDADIAEVDSTLVGSDWFTHTDKPMYYAWLMRHSKKILESKCFRVLGTPPLPGMVAVTQVGLSEHYNHGGIVVAWPKVIHCVKNGGVSYADASLHPMWAYQQMAIFDPFHVPEADPSAR